MVRQYHFPSILQYLTTMTKIISTLTVVTVNTTQNGDDIDLHYSNLDDEVIESSLLDNSNPGNQIPLYDAQISPRQALQQPTGPPPQIP